MLSNNKIAQRSGIVLFLIMVGLPFIAGIVYAFAYSTGLTGYFASGFTLKYFVELMQEGEIFWSLIYSLSIAAVSIFISLLVAFALLFVFRDRLVKSKNSFLLYLPLSIPAIVSAFISFEMLGKTGLFSRIAFSTKLITDLQQFPDLINDRLGFGIIITHVLMASPFFLIYLSNMYSSEKLDEIEAISLTLGASPSQTARKLLLPLLWRKAKPTILLYAIFVFGSYEIPLVLGRQNPQMISVLVIQKAQRYNLMDIPKAYAIALLSVLVISGLILLFSGTSKTQAE